MSATVSLGAPTPHRTSPPELIMMLDRAGLTGHGGGGFPTSRKLAAVVGRRARVVVNACESEPQSGKDAWLVDRHGESLRYGLQLIMDAVGAARGVIAVHDGSATHHRLVTDPRWAGTPLLVTPPRYVASEAGALASLLDGGDARPTTRYVPLTERGVGRVEPVLVLNAETVHLVSRIAAAGVPAFRSRGTVAEPGPRLASVSFAPSGPITVVEADAGVSVADLVSAAGVDLAAHAAVQFGGHAGVWVPAADLVAARWSDADLGRLGAGVGAGVIQLLPSGRCPLAVVEEQLAFLASASARQCGPCMFGLPAVHADWRAAAGSGPAAREARDRAARRVGLLPGRGACYHPDGVARTVAGALRTFAGHLDDHERGVCRAGH